MMQEWCIAGPICSGWLQPGTSLAVQHYLYHRKKSLFVACFGQTHCACYMPAIPHTHLESGQLGPTPRHRGPNPFSLCCSLVLPSTEDAEIPSSGQRSCHQNAKLSSLLPAEGKGPVQEDGLRIRTHFPFFLLWCPPWVVFEVFGDHKIGVAACVLQVLAELVTSA